MSNYFTNDITEKYAHIDAQSRKIGADEYPTMLLFLGVLEALECAVCEQQ